MDNEKLTKVLENNLTINMDIETMLEFTPKEISELNEYSEAELTSAFNEVIEEIVRSGIMRKRSKIGRITLWKLKKGSKRDE